MYKSALRYKMTASLVACTELSLWCRWVAVRSLAMEWWWRSWQPLLRVWWLCTNQVMPCFRFLSLFFFFLPWGLNRFHTLHAAGFVRVLIAELWSVLECSIEDARVVRPKVTPMEPIDRNCHKVPCLTCNVNNSLLEAIFFFLITGFSQVKKPTDEVWTVSCHWRLYIFCTCLTGGSAGRLRPWNFWMYDTTHPLTRRIFAFEGKHVALFQQCNGGVSR